jgi:putative ABC transport system permease protein
VQVDRVHLVQRLAQSLAGQRAGAAGVAIGAAATARYAHAKGWTIVIPAQAWADGLGAALLIGALAGLLPALRAARMSPTEALWTF